MDGNQVSKITRVDMLQLREGIRVSKFSDGWTARTSAVDIHTNATATLPEMAAWFREHGWTVREWPGGARAWLGPALPVRSHWQIIGLRRELNAQLCIYQGAHPLGVQLNTLDLAVDL